MITTLKQGDIIENSKGKRKVLGVCGEVYCLSGKDEIDGVWGWYTLKQINDNGYTLVQPEIQRYTMQDKPGECTKYWYIDDVGDTIHDTFTCNNDSDMFRLKSGNCYKSEDDCRRALEEIMNRE